MTDVRKRRLVSGLQRRLADHRGVLSILSEKFVSQQRELAARIEQAQGEIEASQRGELEEAITAWDMRREESYASSDRVTLAAIRTEAKRQQELNETHTRARQQEIASHHHARQVLDQHYEEQKPKPGKQLERYVALLGSRRGQADEAVDHFRTLMLARGVTVPVLQPSEVESMEPLPSTIAASVEALQTTVTSMKELGEKASRDPMVRWSGSIFPWLIGVTPGVVLGFVLWKSIPDQPYLAMGLTLAALLIVPLGLVFGLMPRVKRRLIGPYRELIRQSERLNAISRHGRQMAETHCRQEQSRFWSEYQDRLAMREDEHRRNLEGLDRKLDEEIRAVRAQQAERRRHAAADCARAIEETDRHHAPALKELSARQKEKSESRRREFERQRLAMEQDWKTARQRMDRRVQVGTARAQARIEKEWQEYRERFPDWENDTWKRGDWSRSKEATSFPIGRCQLAIPPDFHSALVVDYDVLTHGALVIEADRMHRDEAEGVIRTVLARAYASQPMGNLHCTIIDPEGFGKDYAWLMPLADIDPRWVGHRIWTQPAQIAEQLSMLAYQNEEIIQQRLRDRYRNLIEYNREAGPMAEPFRLVVWSHFPSGLDEVSWKWLCALLASGARCGIGVILTVDSNHQPWPVFADRSKLFSVGRHVRLTDRARVVDEVLDAYELQIDPPPDPSLLTSIVEHCEAAALQAGRVEVPFATIGVASEEIGSGVSSEGLVIPLGVAGVGRVTALRLGQGTAQHVLVAGKTGSGKSSLLHTLITGAALKYSPDQLRMVLLDFKKGVEFQVYAQQRLPHAEIIAIESRREFGLSALEYLDRVMHRRGELFRQAGVQDISSWSKARGNQKMPRVLVVIDEFQEMFVEDDKLAQQSAMLLDRVVRQGRSFGIHMVLASQTLGGSYSLPRTTLAQMAVRIALQCDGADAMMILGEDNLAATRLRHSGQAIYNEAGGRIESNQPFQVAYLTASSHVAQLMRIPLAPRPDDSSTNLLGRQIIFEGHKPAIWNGEDIERGWRELRQTEAGTLPIVLGESLSIEPTIVRSLVRQGGRNMAIVGSDDALGANLIGTMIRGWLHLLPHVPFPQIYFLDGARSDNQQSGQLRGWLASNVFIDRAASGVPLPIVCDPRGVDSLIAELHQEWERRMAAQPTMFGSIVLFVVNLARLRELRRNDEFSFGGSGESGKKATDAAFAELLREGPAVGIHVVVWADSWGTLSRFIPRQGLRDLEIRGLMPMSSSDSNQLIDASAANKLESHAMIYFDEADGKIVKFRPYQPADGAEPPP